MARDTRIAIRRIDVLLWMLWGEKAIVELNWSTSVNRSQLSGTDPTSDLVILCYLKPAEHSDKVAQTPYCGRNREGRRQAGRLFARCYFAKSYWPLYAFV